ncbi:hypothetical protein M758_3G001500 [Ceratodon purpureus]|nr:hypothetical protein M758_3G001500 [Ceratodon purpureus]
MPKEKKRAGGSEHLFQKFEANEIPSANCKTFLIELTARFYEANDLRALESKYVRYQEEGVEKFKHEIRDLMIQALQDPKWIGESDRRGFQWWMENRLNDALWNAKVVLAKYAKTHREGDEEFVDVVNRADCFSTQMRAFSKNTHRLGSGAWWRSFEGRQADIHRMTQLIIVPNTASVIPVDKTRMKGRYGTITKVRLEGVPTIEPYWEFAAKTSNQLSTRPELAKLEHMNESLAIRILHPGVIRFVAIHSTKMQGYVYWWNGGTIREMLNRDMDYGDDVFVHLNFGNYPEDEVIRADQLVRFRQHRTELAWALLHIMDEVHKSHHLHNDISPDNILLHFPMDESRVYIGVCDWGLSTALREPMQSLYTFTKREDMEETLQRRYWVDPRVAFLYKAGEDHQIVPKYSIASEEFATARIAQRINGMTMSTAYEQLQRGNRNTSVFNNGDLAQAFHLYMDRVCNESRDSAGGLSHIISRFTDMFHWSTPHEHFRKKYVQ